jgi:5'-3' exonuclease
MILIDTSYFVYFHGFGVWEWYKREFGTKHIPDDGSFDPMSDPEFKAMYKKRFLTKIFNAVQNDVVFFDRGELVFCLDCSKKKIWRNDIFPEYKIKRKTCKKRKFSWNNIFNYTINNIIPEYQEKYGCRVFSNPVAEGDDIIAVLANHVYDHNICKDTIIITSDGDITQLSDKATIITLKGEKKTYQSVMDKKKFKEQIEWTPELFIIHKSIMGDSSDEIPPIIPGVGPKRALKYINNIELLEKLFVENTDAKTKFARNTQLIDFQYIPKEIKDYVIAEFTDENELTNL